MDSVLPILNFVLLVATVVLLLILVRKTSQTDAAVLASRLEAFEKAQEHTERAVREEVANNRDELSKSAREQRYELTEGFKTLGDSAIQRMTEFAGLQQRQLEAFSDRLNSFARANGEQLNGLRTESATGAKQLREEVISALNGITETTTKTMGEMANVQKVQLGTMLEQILNPDQFAANVGTKDVGERVEFAIKLRGQGTNKDQTVWLPIDAKFPIEDYQRLIEAQDKADAEGAELAGKQLENRVKTCARDICEKYLSPPKTMDFGILFLPIEGLFAEVIRRNGLKQKPGREPSEENSIMYRNCPPEKPPICFP